MFPVRNARIPLWAERPDTESLHRSPDHPSSSPYAVVPGKYFPNSALSEVRRLRVYPVDQMEDIEWNRSTVGRLGIRDFPAHSEELGLSSYWERILSDDAGPPLLPIQGVRQIFF